MLIILEPSSHILPELLQLKRVKNLKASIPSDTISNKAYTRDGYFKLWRPCWNHCWSAPWFKQRILVPKGIGYLCIFFFYSVNNIWNTHFVSSSWLVWSLTVIFISTREKSTSSLILSACSVLEDADESFSCRGAESYWRNNWRDYFLFGWGWLIIAFLLLAVCSSSIDSLSEVDSDSSEEMELELEDVGLVESSIDSSEWGGYYDVDLIHSLIVRLIGYYF